MASDSIPPDEPTRQKKARPWRLVTVGGGILLLISFFLPMNSFATFQSGGTSSADVLSDLLEDLLEDMFLRDRQPIGYNPAYRELLVCALLVSPFLPGILVAAVAAFRLDTGYRRLHARPWGVAAALTMTWLLPMACILFEVLNHMPTGTPKINVPLVIVFIALSGAVAYLVRAMLGPAHRSHLTVAFEAGVLTLLSYGYMATLILLFLWSPWSFSLQGGDSALLAGVLGLLVGTIGEARALTRHSWWGTIWRLVLCCLKDAPGKEGCCPQCEYRLFGLTEQRCPECGRPFTFEELGISPQELGFRTAADA